VPDAHRLSEQIRKAAEVVRDRKGNREGDFSDRPHS